MGRSIAALAGRLKERVEAAWAELWGSFPLEHAAWRGRAGKFIASGDCGSLARMLDEFSAPASLDFGEDWVVAAERRGDGWCDAWEGASRIDSLGAAKVLGRVASRAGHVEGLAWVGFCAEVVANEAWRRSGNSSGRADAICAMIPAFAERWSHWGAQALGVRSVSMSGEHSPAMRRAVEWRDPSTGGRREGVEAALGQAAAYFFKSFHGGWNDFDEAQKTRLKEGLSRTPRSFVDMLAALGEASDRWAGFPRELEEWLESLSASRSQAAAIEGAMRPPAKLAGEVRPRARRL